LRCLSALPLLLLPLQLLAQSAAVPEASDIDWVPMDQLSPEQREGIADNCCGLYVAPDFPAVPGASGTTQLQGNQISATEDGLVRIEGGLQAQQQGLVLSADSGSYDRNAATFTLETNIRIRQQGLLLVGASAVVDQNSASSTIESASYVLHDTAARGRADMIVYTDADGIITIDNGVFTRCEPGDNSWLVAGDTIQLDRAAGRGTARHVTLQIKDVPVLYLPWVSFPINDERASGLLAPIIGSTRNGGFDIAVPYYLNLAPNYDMTLTSRVQFERGMLLGAEFRHRGFTYEQEADLQYLPNDKLYDPTVQSFTGGNSAPTDDRWLLEYAMRAAPAAGWSASVNYSAVSDQAYFQDLGNNGLVNTTMSFLYRDAQVQYLDEHWKFSAAAQGFQIIDPAVSPLALPYRSLPRLNLAASEQLYPGIEYGFDSELVYFDRQLDQRRVTPELLAAGALVTGSRLALAPYLSLPVSNAGAFITPTVKYRYANWQLQDQAAGTTSNPERGIFTGSLDSGLIFERPLQFGAEEYLHTLEPRLYYLYTQYEDQSTIPVFDSSELTFAYSQLFRDDRFSGKDRVGDANQLTLALTSRLFDTSGREKGRLSVGQIRHFENRRVTLFTVPEASLTDTGSDFVSEASWELNDNWRATSYLQWSPEANTMEVGNFQFQYQSDLDHIINLGYRYRDDTTHLPTTGFDRTINQTDISAIWPVNDQWGLIGRWNYDHANKRNLETLGGIEYSNCCWNLRVIARQWIDNNALFFGGIEEDNSGIFVQFELKGLGSLLGGNVSGILNNGISGYREREYVQ